MDRAERAAMLREAERMLNEAADLVDGALHMSGMGQRAEGVSDRIREIASGRDGGSLRNMALDMEALEEHPGWTQPLVSPKNLFDRKH